MRRSSDRFPDRQLWCIFGGGTDKDCRGMLEVLSRQVSRLMLVQSSHIKASRVENLQSLLPRNGVNCQVIYAPGSSPREAFMSGFREATEFRDEIVLLVCGSFYVVSAVRAHLASLPKGIFPRNDPVFAQDTPN